MGYAIRSTPSPGDPLSHVAASWLGGIGIHEIAFHAAVPRRYGFHGVGFCRSAQSRFRISVSTFYFRMLPSRLSLKR
jgi:hypothetical protein